MAESEGEEQLQDDSTDEVEELEIVLAGEEDAPSKDGVPKGFKKRINKLNARNEATIQELQAKSQEFDRVQRENELLRLANQPQVKRPRLDDFDGDEDRYHDALDQFDEAKDKRLRDSLAGEVQKLVPAAREDTAPLEAHYERAERLGVSDYEVAEDTVIDALGKDVMKGIAQSMRHSERVIYFLGKNPHKLQEITDLFQTNPTLGTLQLGELQGQLKLQPKKKTISDAETEVIGSGSPAGSGAWQTKINKLRASGEPGTTKKIIALKQEARAAGVTVE